MFAVVLQIPGPSVKSARIQLLEIYGIVKESTSEQGGNTVRKRNHIPRSHKERTTSWKQKLTDIND